MGGFIKRWRWALLVAGLLLLGLAFSFWPRAVLVDAALVSKGRMVAGITDDGQTRAEDVYVVSAPVTGYLERIELEAGDKVARGALVTRMKGRPSTPLDPRSTAELAAAQTAARAAERGAQAALAQSWSDLQRAQKLARDGTFCPEPSLRRLKPAWPRTVPCWPRLRQRCGVSPRSAPCPVALPAHAGAGPCSGRWLGTVGHQ